MSVWRSRWAAIGAAVAVSLGAGGLGLAQATIGTGDKPVTVTIQPQRILDTRTDLGLPGRFVNEVPRDLQVTGSVPVASGGTAAVVPTDATAVVVTVTVVNPDSNGYLSLRPAGATGIPTTSTVNFLPGAIEPNAATVGLGLGGKVQVFVKTVAPAGTADVLVDVVGYTVDHTHDDRYYTQSEVDTALGTKADIPDVYTKSQVDARIGTISSSPIVLGQGHHWVSNGGDPSAVRIYGNVAEIDGGIGGDGGTAHLALVSPITVAGSSYELASVTYCFESFGGFVDTAAIVGLGNGIIGDDLEFAAEVEDEADRSGPGCYTIASTPEVASRRTHHLQLVVSGVVGVAEVTGTWTADS